MGTYSQIILTPASLARWYAEKLLVGIEPTIASRKPRHPDGSVIDTNHPVFILGHLSLYPERIVRMLGGDPASAAAPSAWSDLFKAGSPCHDDPEGKIYPAFGEVVPVFHRTLHAAADVVAGVKDEALLGVTTDEKARERFPTVGSLANFLLNDHVMMHMGQISVWRRCFGLPAAM